MDPFQERLDLSDLFAAYRWVLVLCLIRSCSERVRSDRDACAVVLVVDIKIVDDCVNANKQLEQLIGNFSCLCSFLSMINNLGLVCFAIMVVLLLILSIGESLFSMCWTH